MCDIVWLWASTVIVILKDLMEHHTTLEPNFHNHTSCKIAESPKTAGIPSGAFAFVLPMCYGTGPGMSRAGWRFIPGRPRWVSKQPRDLWSLPEIETKAARVSSHRPGHVDTFYMQRCHYSSCIPERCDWNLQSCLTADKNHAVKATDELCRCAKTQRKKRGSSISFSLLIGHHWIDLGEHREKSSMVNLAVFRWFLDAFLRFP